jgi:hypothetical protein
MNRIKGLYRSWAIPCAGQKVYSPRYRSAWLKKLTEAGVQCRAKWLYRQLDYLQPLGRQARQELLAESRRHPAHTLLRQVPWLGPVRVALLIALIQTPYRFRTKRTTLGVQRVGSGDSTQRGISRDWQRATAACQQTPVPARSSIRITTMS